MDADRLAAQAISPTMIRAVGADPFRWLVPLTQACNRFDITSGPRAVMFMATCAHESSGFSRLVENLRYSSASLLRVFGRYFTPQEATEFSYDDIRIAERVYGGRLGNGAEGTGDGWKYRGRGLIQITGRWNYRECGLGIGLDVEGNPMLLELEDNACLSAAWFWREHGCNDLADKGDFAGVQGVVNRGDATKVAEGMDSREAYLARTQAAGALA